MGRFLRWGFCVRKLVSSSSTNIVAIMSTTMQRCYVLKTAQIADWEVLKHEKQKHADEVVKMNPDPSPSEDWVAVAFPLSANRAKTSA